MPLAPAPTRLQDPRPRRRGPPAAGPTPIILPLNIEELDLQRVLLDELPTRLDLLAHEDREHPLGLDGVLDGHLEQRPLRRVHGGLPELLRVHLAQSLEALNILEPLAAHHADR